MSKLFYVSIKQYSLILFSPCTHPLLSCRIESGRPRWHQLHSFRQNLFGSSQTCGITPVGAFLRHHCYYHSTLTLCQDALKSKGYIYQGKHVGWYSVSDECFYTDSQVATSLNRATGEEIKIAKETGSTVEWTEEINYKFQLSKFRDKLIEHYEAHPEGLCPRYFSFSSCSLVIIIASVAIQPTHQYHQILSHLRSSDTLPDLSVSRPYLRDEAF